jgi:hypothetical protein
VSSEPPYPSGTNWRLDQAEKRLDRMEEGRPGSITGDLRDDLREIKDEIRNLKRATWATFASIVATLAILVQLFGR